MTQVKMSGNWITQTEMTGSDKLGGMLEVFSCILAHQTQLLSCVLV